MNQVDRFRGVLEALADHQASAHKVTKSSVGLVMFLPQPVKVWVLVVIPN